jgi:DNA-directed RNA polymerase specialized sigma24 family protein
MSDSHAFPPARGDEAELFRSFNDRLMAAVARVTRASTPHTVEDACAFAWTEFMRRQPERANCRGWLVVVARHEAWRLEHERFDASKHASVPVDDIEVASDATSPVEAIEIRHDVDAALDVITKLRPRLQRVALLRALQFSRGEISEITGDSLGRVDKLVATAGEQIREILAARRPERASSPRAERLWELEHEPPAWLVKFLGRPPRITRKAAGTQEWRRAWRRAAIALDDYRGMAGAEGFTTLTTARPADPTVRATQTKAIAAVDEYRALRDPGRNQAQER